MALISGSIVERYVIEGVIGEGAMAVVYRARHKDLGSLHAIKQLTSPDAETRERLVQEGRLQSSLRHPNVISVTDLVEIDGLPALVMEYVPGPTLRDLIREKLLNREQTDAVVEGLLHGVRAAHAHGLVHRDLKPANVMIEVTAQGLVPKIADFGLAKILMPDETSVLATRTGWAMGTPAYMAPEQIQDSSSVDERADVFALGAILYELVTGVRCFPAQQRMELWKDICSGKYEPLAKHQEDVPDRMVRAVEGALRTQPDDRISSVTELIETWFEGAPANAHLPIEERLRLWPEDLRTRASSMASEVVPLMDGSGSESLELDHTMAAGGSPSSASDSTPSTGLSGTLAANEKLEPISGSISPTTSANDGPRVASESATEPARPKRSSFAGLEVIAGLVVVLVVALWALNTEGPTPAASQGAMEPTAQADPPPQTPPEPQSTPPFALRNPASEQAQGRLNTAVDALTYADVTQAERLLTGLLSEHKHEPVVHALLAVCHYLRGRNGLSAHESAWAARLARDKRSEMERFIVLMDATWRENAARPALSAQWKAAREALAHPLVEATFFIASRFLVGADRRAEELGASRKRYPSASLLWLVELRILSDREDDRRVVKEAAAALAQHPEAPAIGLEKYRAMARLGSLEEAERGLNHVLVQDANLHRARFSLARIFIEQDRESDRLSQMMLLLGDTTSPIDQLLFLLQHGKDLAGRGRLGEAKKVWDLCAREAPKSRHFTTGMACAWAALDSTAQLRAPGDAAPWVEHIRSALTQPEIDPSIREHFSVLLLWDEARRALDAVDTSKANELLERVKAFKEGQLPLGVGRWLVETIQFELLLRAGEEDDARAQLRECAGASDESLSRHEACARSFRVSRLALKLKENAKAKDASERFLAQGCAPETSSAQVRVDLASLNLEAGEKAVAAGLVRDLVNSWRRADPQLPALRRALALKEELKGVEPVERQ